MKNTLFEGVQSFLSAAGESACYALCIIKIAERVSGIIKNPVEALTTGVEGGYIKYNWENPNDPDNFWVSDPAGFLRYLVLNHNFKVTVRKEPAEYCPQPDEYIVQCWERQVTGKTITHFRLPDWDSLLNSQTVKYGRVASLRVFKAA
jgi:hypothetical protein